MFFIILFYLYFIYLYSAVALLSGREGYKRVTLGASHTDDLSNGGSFGQGKAMKEEIIATVAIQCRLAQSQARFTLLETKPSCQLRYNLSAKLYKQLSDPVRLTMTPTPILLHHVSRHQSRHTVPSLPFVFSMMFFNH